MRKDFEIEGLGVRAIARKYGVHWRTVRDAIGCSVPPSARFPSAPARP
jgi:hypothetical protein